MTSIRNSVRFVKKQTCRRDNDPVSNPRKKDNRQQGPAFRLRIYDPTLGCDVSKQVAKRLAVSISRWLSHDTRSKIGPNRHILQRQRRAAPGIRRSGRDTHRSFRCRVRCRVGGNTAAGLCVGGCKPERRLNVCRLIGRVRQRGLRCGLRQLSSASLGLLSLDQRLLSLLLLSLGQSGQLDRLSLSLLS